MGKHQSTKGGVYTPNSNIRQLSHVYQNHEQAKTLSCPKCGHTITSDWFFNGSKGQYVILPNQGHLPCKSRKRALSLYLVADGSPGIRDFINDLDRCEHGKL